ncbi:MAG: hypothetical protein P4N59_14915 [Negativicutes bacterium]|nr:hypothetical protein [Negativicutes bacterium]
MSVFKTYIGDLEGHSFVWNPDDATYNNGNMPPALSPHFPVLNGLESVGFRLVYKILTGEFYGKQVDWGCWVAKVNKTQIIDFINTHYLWGECYLGFGETDPAFEDELGELLVAVRSLEPGKMYGLVACEAADLTAIHRRMAGGRRKTKANHEGLPKRRLA